MARIKGRALKLVEAQVLGWRDVVVCADGVQGNEKDRGNGKRREMWMEMVERA
jgi:hypothetical protein